MERKSLSGALAARFDAAEQDMRKLMEAFEEPLGRLDATLVDALRSTQSKMLHQFSQLKGKVARAESFRSGVLERHQRILLDSLYPGGALQERTLCALPLLASCGPGLLDDLAALASLESPAGGRSCAQDHQILLP